MADDTRRTDEETGNTYNFNVGDSNSSSNYSPVDETIPGANFSFGGGRQTFLQMAGAEGQYSPTSLNGVGTSAGDFGTPSGPDFIDMLAAHTNARQSLAVGRGYIRPPVTEIDVSTGKTVYEKPGVIGVSPEFGGFKAGADVARTMALSSGKPYAGRVVGASQYAVTSPKESYDEFDISEVTDEQEFAEKIVSGVGGIFGTLLMGPTPDIAKVRSLETGRTGSYAEFGGILGAVAPGGNISYENTAPTSSDSDVLDTAVADATTPTSTRFRGISRRFPSITSTRFPTPPSPYRASGGYIGDAEAINKAVSDRKRGYHAFAYGGQAYAVEPDSLNPGKYTTYNADESKIKSMMGEKFGYEPSSIDLSKFPGEPGFGKDLVSERAKMAIGGPVGFVGQTPDKVPNSDTVADDVPLDVPKGTFILNAPAVERAGIKDIKDMLMEALVEAEKQGIDISSGDNKLSKENTVALLVSKGEVAVPPLLAKIIGYETLEKINNRGLREVENRQNGQEQPVDTQMRAMAATGGVQGLYQYSSVKEIDERADLLLTQMRDEINSRVSQIDRSGTAQQGIAERAQITEDVLSKYHDDLRSLKENSDPYAFQMFQDRNTDKTLDLQNALEFGDYGSQREKTLADKATTSINIPFGGEDDRVLGDTGLVGFAFPYIGDGDRTAYVAGQKTENTDPSSTARHETAHLEFKGRENLKLTPIKIGDTTFNLNEEQLLRLLDLDRTKNEGLEGEYERAMKFVTQNRFNKIRAGGLSALLRMNSGVTREEIESNLPSIIEQINKVQDFK